MELFASAPDLARQLLASMTENEKMREALAVARPLIYEGMSNHVEGTPTCADWNKRSEIFFAMHDALPSPPSPKG